VAGETIPLEPNDEASVFTTGSFLTAQNGFTGYWHAGDLGSFTEPWQGTDSDFIQVNVLPGGHNVFTVLSDLLLVTGYPYSPSGVPVDFAIPEVQILGVTAWQEVRFTDGSLGFVDVGEGEEIADQIFGAYEGGQLGFTSFQLEFDSDAPAHVAFPDTQTSWRIENGEVVYVDLDLEYGGYDITGNYFLEVVTTAIDPIYASVMSGADIHPNGRYVVMKGEDGVETLENGFRTDAWGDGWLQRIPFASTVPPATPGVHVRHVLASDDQSVLIATGAYGDPAGEDASVTVETPAGAAGASGIVNVSATAIGGDGASVGGSARVSFDAVAYSGSQIVLTGRAEGGDAPTPGTALAEISDSMFSMGLAYPASSLSLGLSAAGGSATGGARANSSLVFSGNSISGWGGVDRATVTLGEAGENSGVTVADNSFSLGANNDRLTIVVNGTGAFTFSSTNQIRGGDGFDILTLDVVGGITFSLGAPSSAFVTDVEVIRGGRDDDTLTGDSAKNYLQGEKGHDLLSGGFGDDVLDGGPGNDGLDGGISGNDTVTFEQLEVAPDGVTVTSRAIAGVTANLSTGVATGAGADTLSNFENVRGTGFNDNLTGDNNANLLNGLAGDDTLDGGWGDDWLIGGPGNDMMIGGNGWDTADYSAQVPENLFTPSFNVTGGVQIDLRITGSQDTGSAGIDQLTGVENLVGTSFNDQLVGDDFANHLVGGAGRDTLYGNGSADTLIGNSGDDTLDGGSGADLMYGAAGNDFYLVDSASDRAVEQVGEGFDTVFAGVNFTLEAGSEVEALRAADSSATTALNFTGNAFGQILSGNDGGNRLNGGGGDDYLEARGGIDTLDGGTGADVMRGGTGDDYYLADNVGDRMLEAAGEGFDTIFTTASLIIETGSEVEALRVTDAASTNAIDLMGSEYDQVISGNAGDNRLSGRGGDDYLEGRGGVDTLDGGTGADVMRGGTGDDYYIIENGGDRILENAGEGFDTAFVNASFSLEAGMEVEALRASDASSTATMILWGNEFGQIIQGTAGINLLIGYAGDDYLEARGGEDRLEGGAGNDVLIGGADDDVFAFTETGYTDRILDFASGHDRINLQAIDAVAGGGDDAFAWIGSAAFTGVAGQLRAYSSGGVNYLAGDADGNGVADFTIDIGNASVVPTDILF
jgi:Ca2+-binding RTX toxin-like protein